MTGYEILKRCNDLLGFKDASGDDDIEVSSYLGAVEYINQVYLDISVARDIEYRPIYTLDDKIESLSAKEETVLLYGVCMWLSFSMGDGEKNAVFTQLYNSKRAGLTATDTIRDTMPSPEG